MNKEWLVILLGFGGEYDLDSIKKYRYFWFYFSIHYCLFSFQYVWLILRVSIWLCFSFDSNSRITAAESVILDLLPNLNHILLWHRICGSNVSLFTCSLFMLVHGLIWFLISSHSCWFLFPLPLVSFLLLQKSSRFYKFVWSFVSSSHFLYLAMVWQ